MKKQNIFYSSKLKVQTHQRSSLILTISQHQMICVNDLAEPKIKILGVHIDPFLTFKDHIQHLNSKLSIGLFFLRSVKNVLNEKALKSLHYSLIHCHVIYALHVYSSAADGLLKTIFKKQKMALRIITNSQYNAHTEPI